MQCLRPESREVYGQTAGVYEQNAVVDGFIFQSLGRWQKREGAARRAGTFRASPVGIANEETGLPGPFAPDRN